MHIGYEGSDPQDDKQDDIDSALAAAKAEALAKSITEDDVYEFACSLEIGRAKANRERIAEHLRIIDQGKFDASESVALLALGKAIHEMLNENRAHRAEQKFWEEV